LSAIVATPLGSIGLILLPTFGDELYADPDRLAAATVDALELAGRAGARCVSLTGLIPSATDDALRVARAAAGRGLPPFTTRYATTSAAVALSVERLLTEAGRRIEGEHVGFLGLGPIGRATLELMLARMPHPRAITLCDLTSQSESLEQIRARIARSGFRGEVEVLAANGPAPEGFRRATLVVGATSRPDVLDVDALPPGTLVADYSEPRCFDAEQARRRLERDADVLFTESGALHTPWPMRQTSYVPAPAERHLDPRLLEAVTAYHPRRITGCVLSGLVSAQPDGPPPTLGPPELSDAVAHLERLTALGFRGAEPHLDNAPLPPEQITEFRRRFGK
jgi:hypothetical protein